MNNHAKPEPVMLVRSMLTAVAERNQKISNHNTRYGGHELASKSHQTTFTL